MRHSSANLSLDYELQPTQPGRGLQEGDHHGNEASSLREFALPPVDRGKGAWLCLMGAFVLEMMVWGFPYSFGVFQDYYTITAPFNQNASRVSMIGSCTNGILYLASPFSLFILQRWPHLSRASSIIGLIITVVGIILSAFATRVWQLLLTQGVIYPIGACMLYYPLLLFIDEWFVQRKGLAFGICWAGSGVAGVVFPFVVTTALSRFTFKTTMLAWGVAMVSLVCPFLPFVKPRIRTGPSQAPRPQYISFRFLRSRTFLIFQAGNLLQSLGYFAPSLYLPTYSRSVLGERSSFGITTPLTLMNAGLVIGFILVGFLVDRWHVANVLFLTTTGTVVGVFAIWGLSITLPPLCIFAVLYGIFAGSASSTWPGIVHAVKQADNTAPAGLILGLFTAGRGVGSIACGPISELLLNSQWPWTGKTGALGYGTRFGGLITFTGVMALFGVVGFGARQMGFLR